MSDFNYSLGFEVKGDQNIKKVIQDLKNAGVEVDKLTKRQEKLFNSEGKQVGVRNVGKFGVSAADLSRLRAAESIVARMGGKEFTKFHSTEDFKKIEMNAQKEHKIRHAIQKMKDKEYEREFSALVKQEKARLKYESDFQKLLKEEETQREKVLQAEQRIRSAIAKKNLAEQKKAEDERERALKEEQRIRLAIEKSVQREKLKNQKLANNTAFDGYKIGAINKVLSGKNSLSESKASKMDAEAKKRILDLVQKSRRAQKAASEETLRQDAAVARGDMEAARRHKFLADQYVSDARRMATAAENASNRSVAAHRKEHGSLKKIHDEIHRMKTYAGGFLLFQGLEKAAELTHNIAHSMFEAFKHSLHFNDEMEKNNAIFTGFGIANTGKSATNIAFQSGTPQEKNQLVRAEKVSETLITTLRGVAARSGMPLNEMIAGFKGVVPEILTRIKVPKGKNALLENAEGMDRFAKRFTELAAISTMMDPRHQGIRIHEKNIAYAFQGTNEHTTKNGKKGKDPTAQLINRLRHLEHIQLSEDEAHRINSFVNSGKSFKAMDILEGAYARSGISANKITDMNMRTMDPNIKGIKSMTEFFGGQFTKPSFNVLLNFLTALNSRLVDLSKDKPFMSKLTKWGESFAEVVKKVTFRVGDMIESMIRGDYDEKISAALDDFKKMYELAESFGSLGSSFLSGFFKNDSLSKIKSSSDQFQSLKQNIEKCKPAMELLGEATWRVVDGWSKILYYSGLALSKFIDFEKHRNAPTSQDNKMKRDIYHQLGGVASVKSPVNAQNNETIKALSEMFRGFMGGGNGGGTMVIQNVNLHANDPKEMGQKLFEFHKTHNMVEIPQGFQP